MKGVCGANPGVFMYWCCIKEKGLKRGGMHISSSDTAFAARLGGGSVVTWGDADGGGDSSLVQGQLKGVQHIYSTKYAFAALLGSGGGKKERKKKR